jgi:hemolysin activation/secretion protein
MSAVARLAGRLRKGCAAVVAGLSLLGTTLPAAAQGFSIRAVDFTDSAYLSEADLQAVAARYTGRTITFEDLQAMLAEVQQLYTAAGIVTAQAVLPPQDIVDGTLRIQLVEAAIESVEIEGFERTDAEFLRGNLTLPEGELPDFEQIERDLRIFDIAHDVAPQLSFVAGGTPGTTRVVISGTEPAPTRWIASLDNFGREETGEWRASLFGRWSSVSGRRDILSLQAQFSEGARFAAVGYSVPVGPRGGRLIAAASYGRSDIIAGEFEVINLVSDLQNVGIAFTRPFAVTGTSHWTFEGGVGYERNTSTTTGLTFSDITIRGAYAAVSYDRSFALSSLSAGVGLRSGSASAEETTETEGSFYALYGYLDYARRLTRNMVFEADITAQLAPDENLPVARLFTVGGPTTLRGYPNNIRGGDSGFLARLQLSRAEPIERGDFAYRPFGFFDAALVVPYRTEGGIDTDQDLLASIGGGVRMQYRDSATVLLMAGVPLRETQGFTDTGKATVYFGVDYQF